MQQDNPYQAPAAELKEPVQSRQDELAGRWQRVGASLLDALINLAFAVPLMFVLGTWEMVMRGLEPPFSLLATSVFLGVVGYSLIHGYFLHQSGQTIGKKLIGIKTTMTTGEKPNLGVLIGLRFVPVQLVTLIPVVGSFLPLIDALFIFGSSKRCLHDYIAGTKVVRC